MPRCRRAHQSPGAGKRAGRRSIETWARVAAAVGDQLVGFLELAPGATPPRDIEHLRRQSALIAAAAAGGWTALPELAIDPGAIRSRSIDVALIRRAAARPSLVEVWDWFDDVGASLRGLDAKVEVLDIPLRDEPINGAEGLAGRDAWRVRGLFVVRRHAAQSGHDRRAPAAVRVAVHGTFDGMAPGARRRRRRCPTDTACSGATATATWCPVASPGLRRWLADTG